MGTHVYDFTIQVRSDKDLSDDAVSPEASAAVLYEEDRHDAQGHRYVGSAKWRVETISSGTTKAAVRADIEIPERRMSVTWSLRLSRPDPASAPTYFIEIAFNLPAGFSGGGVNAVHGILMKQSAQARGTPLIGKAVNMTAGLFRAYLSAAEPDMQRNLMLLNGSPWLDIAIVYADGTRAIIALEKGTSGERALARAFPEWNKLPSASDAAVPGPQRSNAVPGTPKQQRETAVELTDPYANDYAKGANAHMKQEKSRYTQERDAFFDQVRIFHFAIGCKVFGERPGIIIGLLTKGNEYLEQKYSGIYIQERQTGLLQKLLVAAQNEGLARASQAGACDYWHQHPEAIYELRRAATDALN